MNISDIYNTLNRLFYTFHEQKKNENPNKTQKNTKTPSFFALKGIASVATLRPIRYNWR